MKKQNKKGFTLIEIMIVAAIIALLAVIAIPAFTQARTKSQANICISNLRVIAQAKNEYMLDNNVSVPPTVMSELMPYFVKRDPVCPLKGTYSINNKFLEPSCSVGGTHVYE